MCCKVKLERAQGGCLGTESRRRTRQAAKSSGEAQTARDPEISEWGNPHGKTPCIHTPIHNVWKGTGGTETSKYPEEKKETSISKVAASEMERAQTVVRAPRGCGLHKVLESIAEQFWEI